MTPIILGIVPNSIMNNILMAMEEYRPFPALGTTFHGPRKAPLARGLSPLSCLEKGFIISSSPLSPTPLLHGRSHIATITFLLMRKWPATTTATHHNLLHHRHLLFLSSLACFYMPISDLHFSIVECSTLALSSLSLFFFFNLPRE